MCRRHLENAALILAQWRQRHRAAGAGAHPHHPAAAPALCDQKIHRRSAGGDSVGRLDTSVSRALAFCGSLAPLLPTLSALSTGAVVPICVLGSLLATKASVVVGALTPEDRRCYSV